MIDLYDINVKLTETLLEQRKHDEDYVDAIIERNKEALSTFRNFIDGDIL